MDEDEIKRLPPDEIVNDETAEDLLDSPNMQPYVRLAMAGLQEKHIESRLRAIRDLPLEKRYIW
jgi:hypothetical protein